MTAFHRFDEATLYLLHYGALAQLTQHQYNSNMGVFDPYCALCGGPFKLDLQALFPYSDDAEVKQTKLAQTLSAHTVNEQHHIATSWIRDVRVIGRNLSTGKSYVTGLGTAEDYGWALVERGDDENVPDRDFGAPTMRLGPDGVERIGLPCYFDWSAMGSGDDGAGFPMHEACWRILGEAFARRSGAGDAELDVGCLRKAMEGLLKSSANCLGGMDYFEFQLDDEEIWNKAESVAARAVSWTLGNLSNSKYTDNGPGLALQPLSGNQI
jgi:hypothetical protein